MNAVGRQMQRSGSTGHRHRRQHSDNFIDTAFTNKWLQSGGLHHLQGSRLGRNAKKGVNGGGNELSDDSSALSVCSRSLSMRSGDQVLPSELNPGLLDLYSFDTELLPEISSLYNRYSVNQSLHGRSLDDTEPCILSNRLTNGVHGLPENNLPRSFSTDKEKPGSVAKIKVVVRKRPLNKREIAKKEEDIIVIDSNNNSLIVHETKLKVDLTEYVEKHEFVFDAVLNEDISNDRVYSETVEPMIPLIFQKIKATCFAYGQTGSGKTYTMQPLPLKASEDIFQLMRIAYQNHGFQLFVSFFEIYGGKVFDLLNDRRKLCMREDGKQQVCIVGLQEYRVSDVETVKELIEKGSATRSTGTTGANEESSRSHAILQLAIKRSVDGSESKPARLVGKLSFIDLAGSERGADTTDNDKQTRMEGAEINKSLLALKECIRALDNDQGHIPFRGSKLTEVLRDSFVGDSRTVMISCISPSSGSCEHTLNTLRYADRVKGLSKGNSSRRDPVSSSLNLRSSTGLPLSSVTPTVPSSDDDIVDVPHEISRFGWPKQLDLESSPSLNIERIPSGRAQGSVSSCNGDQRDDQGDIIKEDFDYSGETYEQEKPSWIMDKRAFDMEDKTRQIGPPTKRMDLPDFESNKSHSDYDLNALLKEEEDLVTAHKRLVEETMDIVHQEMNLLLEVDQPGSQLDNYISRLNAILSHKAAGVLQLQTRLAHFQRHMKDYGVLVSSSGH